MNRKLGRYNLVQKLRSGGMAEVFLGVVDGPGDFKRKVAVKVVLPCFAQDPEFRTMFMDEAAIGARLSHANIAQIYDFDIEDGVPYIAMEYLEGKDLRSVLERCGQLGRSLPWKLVAQIALEVAKGLYYVHNKREFSRPLLIVHRDISPQNIMISFSGEVKILDFGIAKAAGSVAVTRAGQVKGKCAYMSPEQALGHPVDARSDLFSLGVVMWELLTGRKLFGDDLEVATLRKLMACEFPNPHELNPKVPREFSDIVMSCLAKEPQDRYANLIQLYEKVSALLFSKPGPSTDKALAGLLAELFPEEVLSFVDGLHPWAAKGASGDPGATRKLGAGPAQEAPPEARDGQTPSSYVPWDKGPATSNSKPPRPHRPPDSVNVKLMVLATLVACVAAVLAWVVVLTSPPAKGPAGAPQQAPEKPSTVTKEGAHRELSPEQLGMDPEALAEAEAKGLGRRRQHFKEAALPGEASAQRALELVYSEEEDLPGGGPGGTAAEVDHGKFLRQAQRARREAARPPQREKPGQADQPPQVQERAAPEAPETPEAPAAQQVEELSQPEPATLVVSAKPWGKVYQGGKLVGDTPQTLLLPPGTPDVTVEYLGQTHRCTGRLEAGERARCYFEFDRQTP